MAYKKHFGLSVISATPLACYSTMCKHSFARKFYLFFPVFSRPFSEHIHFLLKESNFEFSEKSIAVIDKGI